VLRLSFPGAAPDATASLQDFSTVPLLWHTAGSALLATPSEQVPAACIANEFEKSSFKLLRSE
jgi:hypothetical protein